MRSWLLMFLLLVSIFIHHAQGIRLIKDTSVPSNGQHSFHQEQVLPGKRSNERVEEGNLCKSKKCGSGRIRKLRMIHSSITTSINAENDKINDEIKLEEALCSTNKKIARKEEHVSVKSSSEAQLGQAAPEPFPDTIDMAGMDYSLHARRRPPIHN